MRTPPLAIVCGDRRHLQRRDEQLALADRHAADVDARVDVGVSSRAVAAGAAPLGSIWSSG